MARLPLVTPDKLHGLVLPCATTFAVSAPASSWIATQITAVKNRLQAKEARSAALVMAQRALVSALTGVENGQPGPRDARTGVVKGCKISR